MTPPPIRVSPEDNRLLLEEVRNLADEVRGLRGDFRVLNAQLLGSPDGEDSTHGRVPRVETTLAEHTTRIQGLERIRWGGHALVVLASLLASVATAVYMFSRFLR